MHGLNPDADAERARRRAHYASLQPASFSAPAAPANGSPAATAATPPLSNFQPRQSSRLTATGNAGKATDTNALRSLRYSVLRGEIEAVQHALTTQAFKVDDFLDTKAKQTALHLAASKGRENIVHLLLDHNADAAAVDGAGKTAADIATEKGFPVIANNLQAFLRSQQSAQAIQSKLKKKDGESLSVAPVAPTVNWRKNSSPEKNFMSLPMGASMKMYQSEDDPEEPFATSNLNPGHDTGIRGASSSVSGVGARSRDPSDPAAAGADSKHSASGHGHGHGHGHGTGDMSALFRSLPVGSTLADLEARSRGGK